MFVFYRRGARLDDLITLKMLVTRQAGNLPRSRPAAGEGTPTPFFARGDKNHAPDTTPLCN